MANVRLRRSFSLDFVNDDTATVFLTGDNVESSTTTSSSTVTNDSKPPLTMRSFQLHSNGGSLALNSSPTTGSSGTNNTVVSPSIQWHDSPDIDDALAADFDGSLSGLGMEVGTSSYNMSDALLALPILKNEHPNHKGVHLRSDSHPPYLGHHSNSQNHSHHPHHTHHHHHHHSDTGHTHLQSICNSTGSGVSSSNALTNGTIPNDEHRPVAIVHGKKNRLALGHDDELSVSTAIKRVCINNDREASQENSRFSISTLNSNSNTRDSAGGDSSGTECNHEDCDNSLRCNKHSSSAPDLRQGSTDGSIHPHHSSESSPSPSSSSVLTHILHSANNAGPINLLTQQSIVTAFNNSSLNSRQATTNKQPTTSSFQYTLGAPTSVATKLHEETMTYLNQGQPYEIKLKLTDSFPGIKSNGLRKFRSVIRVGFHERRLQYMEKELINQWRDQRQERILEIDIPLSYGIGEIICDPMDINRCSFVWDSNKDAGIFIKVNCISTEFTPKKHGGEKGVPFRLIIETYSYNGSLNNSSSPSISPGNILHAASSQVKVFKPKGADRKHKTDREKMMRRSDQEKFRASNDITIFTPCPLDQLLSSSSLLTSRTVITALQGNNCNSDVDGSIVKISHLKRDTTNASSPSSGSSSVVTPSKLIAPAEPIDFTGSSRNILDSPINPDDGKGISSNSRARSGTSGASAAGGGGGTSGGRSNASANISSSSSSSIASGVINVNGTDVALNGGTNYSPPSFLLTCDASSDETMQWLALNRFERFHKIFSNFSGADILRLTRDDLTMLCGLGDGIRLYNCLHCINIRPRLTIYVNCGNDEDFSAIYLDNLTVSELKSKLRNLLMCSTGHPANSPTSDGDGGNSNGGHSPSNYIISRIRVAAPQNGIFINVTDEVVRNIASESMFLVNFDKEGTAYRATLHHFKST